MIVQVKCFRDSVLVDFENEINKWLEEHIAYVTIRDIKVEMSPSGWYIGIIIYEKDTAEEFIDKMVKGELE